MTQQAHIERIDVAHGQGQYPVYIGQGLISQPLVWSGHLSGQVLVVTEDQVAKHYRSAIERALSGLCTFEVMSIPTGEGSKSVTQWSAILDRLVGMNAQRDTTVIALGGGVVGDLAGFAAASYMRGVRVIQMPTTLLAQVDASIGGKTGINHPMGKNLIGAFHAPHAVVIDLASLATLPDRDYRAGLAEVIKYGALGDLAFFEWLEAHTDALNKRDTEILRFAIQTSVEAKKAVVMRDEKESGERALLNFGHTFAHALEALTDYTSLRHGEAVAIGMVLATRLSERLGQVPAGTAARLKKLIEKVGLPSELPAGQEPKKLIERMRLDKKNKDNTIRLVLLTSLGHAVVQPCPEEQIAWAFE